eukprot:IDg6479t1
MPHSSCMLCISSRYPVGVECGASGTRIFVVGMTTKGSTCFRRRSSCVSKSRKLSAISVLSSLTPTRAPSIRSLTRSLDAKNFASCAAFSLKCLDSVLSGVMAGNEAGVGRAYVECCGVC